MTTQHESKLQHSPLPWSYVRSIVMDGEANTCAIAQNQIDERKEENAKFIVQACNSFYRQQEIIGELLRACKDVQFALAMSTDCKLGELRETVEQAYGKLQAVVVKAEKEGL